MINDSYSVEDLKVGEEVMIVIPAAKYQSFVDGNILIKSDNDYLIRTAAVDAYGNFCVFADGSGIPSAKVARKVVNRKLPVGVYSTNQELCYKLKV